MSTARNCQLFEALSEAVDRLTAEREELVASHALWSHELGAYDESTLDALGRELVDEADDLLARWEAALRSGGR
ncbi:MAG: hypothetical protein ACOCY0_04635 [Roseicyclus sp.]